MRGENGAETAEYFAGLAGAGVQGLGGHFDHGGNEGRRHAVPAYIGDEKAGAMLVDRKKLVEIAGHSRHGLIGGSNLQLGDAGYAFGKNRELQLSGDG